MAFKIEIRDNNKSISFGPRILGQSGRDILAIKLALGIIKELKENSVELGNTRSELGATGIQYDNFNWFDCSSGRRIQLEDASLFDLSLQTAIRSFQNENKFLIYNYYFEKLSIPVLSEIVKDPISNITLNRNSYEEIIKEKIKDIDFIFESEFGNLGEGTLAVMHGWVPYSFLGAEGYIHNSDTYTSNYTPVFAPIPTSPSLSPINVSTKMGLLWIQSEERLKENNYLMPATDERGTSVNRHRPSTTTPSAEFKNNLKSYIENVGSTSDWILGKDDIDSFGTQGILIRIIEYRPIWTTRSLLLQPAKQILENKSTFSESAFLNNLKDRKDKLKNFFYPDPFSTTEPFIIDEDTIGYFYETNFELSDKGPVPSNTEEERHMIEDMALEKVLESYGKPQIWNFLSTDHLFVNTYKIKSSDKRPDHFGTYPLSISKERIENTPEYKSINIKIKSLKKNIQRLKSKKNISSKSKLPKTQNPNSTQSPMASFNEKLDSKILGFMEQIETLTQRQQQLLSGAGLNKHDFWVLSSGDTLNRLPNIAAQSWREVESPDAEPLIKFIEYRTPPLRPGLKFRALVKINREKLDLIIYGTSIGAEVDPEVQPSPSRSSASETVQRLQEESRSSTLQVCESEPGEQSLRTVQEYRNHSIKRRRQLRRALQNKMAKSQDSRTSSRPDRPRRTREDDSNTSTFETPDTTTVDLGIFGPLNMNGAFESLYGLNGISDDYTYTQKAISMLLENSTEAAELLGILDNASEDLNDIIEDTNKAPKTQKEALEQISRQFNTIRMPYSVFKDRIKEAAQDLEEAAKVIKRKNIKFAPGSNFNANKEAQILKKIPSQFEEFFANESVIDAAPRASGTKREEWINLITQYSEEEIEIQIAFLPVKSPNRLGPKEGKRVGWIEIFTPMSRTFSFSVIYCLDGQYDKNVELINGFEALSRPRTVNYLSYIENMTNPFPDSFGDFIKSFWEDKRASCEDLGIDSEKGIAIALIGNYTSGIAIDLSDDRDFTDAFVDWAKANFIDPAKVWVNKSAENLERSLDDTFDEEAVLKSFGELCTLEQLYEEFIDKVDLKALLCDYLKCLKLPAFQFKLPSLYLPPIPSIPIIGFYKHLVKFLVEKFKEILIRILCTFVRTIIDKLAFPFCEEQLEDFIAAGSSATPLMNEALVEALTNTGITSGNEPAAKALFEEASQITTGRELCHILDGKPLDDAGMLILRRLVEKNNLQDDLRSDEDIINYFGVLGTYIPFEICEALESLPTSENITGETESPTMLEDKEQAKKCEQLVDLLRSVRNRIQTNDGTLTDQEIDDVLEIAKDNMESKKKELEALSGMSLDSALPEEFQTPIVSPSGEPLGLNFGKLGVSTQLINSSMPDFLKETLSDAASNMFFPAKTAYISALSNYVPAMKVQTSRLPAPGEENYNFLSKLRLESALEQIKNYTKALEESSPSRDLSPTSRAAALGLTERAQQAGLGDWIALAGSDLDNLSNKDFKFLLSSRDIEDENIRNENQQAIENLIKKEIERTLKIKQIFSSFLIFEKFGNMPFNSALYWKQDINYWLSRGNPPEFIEMTSLPEHDSVGDLQRDDVLEMTLATTRENCRQILEQSAAFSNAWKLDISDSSELRLGLDRAEEIFYDSEQKEFFQHGGGRVAYFVREQNKLIKYLRNTSWWKNWSDDLYINQIEYSLAQNPDNISWMGDLVEHILSQIDKVSFSNDLELIVPSDAKGEIPFVSDVKPNWYTHGNLNHERKTYNEKFRTNKILSLRNTINSDSRAKSRIDEILDSAINFFYYDGQPNTIWGRKNNLSSANGRANVFGDIKGSPLFLVDSSIGWEFLPRNNFGEDDKILENMDTFRRQSRTNSRNDITEGYDIFLPNTFTDFVRSYPDDFLQTVAEMNVSLTGAPGFLQSMSENKIDILRPLENYSQEPMWSNADKYMDIDPYSGTPRAYKLSDSLFFQEGTYNNFLYPINASRAIDLTLFDSGNQNFSGLPGVANLKPLMGRTETPNSAIVCDLAVGHPFHQSILFNETDVPMYGLSRHTVDEAKSFFTNPKRVNSFAYTNDMTNNDWFYSDDERYKNAESREVILSGDKSSLHRHYQEALKRFADPPESELAFADRSTVQFRCQSPAGTGRILYTSTVAEYILEDLEKKSPIWLKQEGEGNPVRPKGLNNNGSPTSILFENDRYQHDYPDPLMPGSYDIGKDNDNAFYRWRTTLIPAKTFFSIPRVIKKYLPSIYLASEHHHNKSDGSSRGIDSVYYYGSPYTRYLVPEEQSPRISRGGYEYYTKDHRARKAYMNLIESQRRKMGRQLYMKIIRLLSHRKITYSNITIPICNKKVLQDVVLKNMEERIKILEEATLIYGNKTPETWKSAYTMIDASRQYNPAENFTGYNRAGSGGIKIMPSLVRKLFTVFETERVPRFAENPEENETPEYDYYFVRYYQDSSGQEVRVSNQDFVNATRDETGQLSGRSGLLSKDLYFKPYSLPREEEMYFRTAEVQVEGSDPPFPGMDFPTQVISYVLGDKYGQEAINENIIFNDPNLPPGVLKAQGEILLKKLLLDDDNDFMIEFEQITSLDTVDKADILYENNPTILDIANNRIEKLTGIVVQELQNMQPNMTQELLPAISSMFSLIKNHHPSMGENLNIKYQILTELGREGGLNKDAMIGLTFAQGPYQPSIKMVEYETEGGVYDRYNIVIDSDLQLSLGPDFTVNNPWIPFAPERGANPDQKNPERLDKNDTSSRKILRFCDSMPESITDQTRSSGLGGRITRRTAFKARILNALEDVPMISDMIDQGTAEGRETLGFFGTKIYDEVTSNIFKDLTECMETSPIFNSEYTDDLDRRVSGKAIVSKTPDDVFCVTNRYSLEAGSILSFDDVIVGDAVGEVMKEMNSPDNNYYNRDLNKPEPFDKAITTISIKAFIRTCLIDLLLKGGICYSIWDIESVISTPIYLEYVKAHVTSELNKSKLLGTIWSTVIQNSTGINNPSAALGKIVKDEAIKLPKYSKQLFHPQSPRKDFHNWYAYGKTLFRDQRKPVDEEGDLIKGVSDTDFFTKHGAFYRIPVPNSELNSQPFYTSESVYSAVDAPSYGRSHVGLPALSEQLERRIFGSDPDQHPDYSENSRMPSTAKLVFEDYIRVSGRLATETSNLFGVYEFEESESVVLSFEDYNNLIEYVRQEYDDEVSFGIINQSQILLGKRLTLLLSGDYATSNNPDDLAIRVFIRKIYENFQLDQDFQRHSYKEKAYIISQPESNVPIDVATSNQGNRQRLLLCTIPLTSYEESLSEICEDGTIPLDLKQPIGPLYVNLNNGSEMFLSHSNKFAKEQEFIDMLEFIFPVRRYIAMSSIFSTSILGAFNDVPNLFGSTKIQCAAAGRVASTPFEKRKELAPNPADFLKSVQNNFPGDMSDSSCFEFPGLGGEFFSAFWEELIRLMKYFPSIIFRGIASQIDPMYKEMRSHYLNCDLKELNWTALTGLTGVSKLTNGRKGSKYASILFSAPADFYLAYPQLYWGIYEPMLVAVLKTVAYVYSGMLPFIDLGAFFKVPCADIDSNWKEGQRYDAGFFGRYGQPMTPFTALALSTLQLPADKDRRRSACEFPEESGQLPDEECIDTGEETDE